MKNQTTQQCGIISRLVEHVVIKKDSSENGKMESNEKSVNPSFTAFNGLMDNRSSIYVVGPYLGSPRDFSQYV